METQEEYDVRQEIPRLLLYLVGAPGAGKSTVMAELTRDCERLHAKQPFAHDVLLRARDDDRNCDVAVELGRRREVFSGTDALSMSVQPKAVQWIYSRPHRLVLGEGARLGTAGFLGAAKDAGYHVVLVHLDATDAQLCERVAQRSGTQSATWAQGARTRALRLVERMADTVTCVRMSTDAEPAVLADRLLGLHWRLAALRDPVPAVRVEATSFPGDCPACGAYDPGNNHAGWGRAAGLCRPSRHDSPIREKPHGHRPRQVRMPLGQADVREAADDQALGLPRR
jgi:ribose 1,5-bisphosphokinase PhnN